MVHVPADSSRSCAELKPLDIYLELLTTLTVHRRVSLLHESSCPGVTAQRCNEFWILDRDVAILDTSTVWTANTNKPAVDLKDLNLLLLKNSSSLLEK